MHSIKKNTKYPLRKISRGPSRAKVSDMMFASQEEGNLWESEHWSSFGHEYDE